MAVTFTRERLKSQTKTQGDFHLAHRFNVEIDGISVGGVVSVDGLTHEHETVEWHDGEDITTHFRPGRQKPGIVTITREWAADKAFLEWKKKVNEGRTERRAVSIAFLNDAGEESMRINLYDCYPTTWSGPNLNARTSAHATESIKIVYERMDWK